MQSVWNLFMYEYKAMKIDQQITDYLLDNVLERLEACKERLGIPWEQLGAQSGRIGGATDLFASGASPAVMQIAGRWVRMRRLEPPTARARAEACPIIRERGGRASELGRRAW